MRCSSREPRRGKASADLGVFGGLVGGVGTVRLRSQPVEIERQGFAAGLRDDGLREVYRIMARSIARVGV